MKRKSPITRIVGTLALPVAMYLIMMALCFSHGKMYFGTWNMWKTLIVDIALSVTCAMGIGLAIVSALAFVSGLSSLNCLQLIVVQGFFAVFTGFVMTGSLFATNGKAKKKKTKK